jgi:hypothetical protein
MVMASTAAGWVQEPVDFAHDVLPVLRDRCARCHSSGTYEGDFSIDTRQTILDSGNVEPGDPAASEMIQRIQSIDPDYRMPPTGKRLTTGQIEQLSRWIGQDLPWQAGFTFLGSDWKAPIGFVEVSLPDGAGNPIDRILDAYFAGKQIASAAAASDNVFLRRVYLDLIGILPTIEEQEAFLNDRDPARRERLVKSLLSRNRDYADHWMSFWNDLLRNDYAGTGYIDGGRKQITRWLHRSLYENKPYDQFVRELISPDGESEGFIRGIQWRGDVNASQVREVQFSQNISQVFLGENIKCASCHDSFINRWKLSDAYSLAAIISDHPLEMVRCDVPTGEFATPGFLWPELGDIPATATTPEERLRELSQLMTSRNNGRLARTIANRIWARLMGQGIVEPVDVMGNRPFDERLLDYLANYLRDHDYNLRSLMELIATSRVYQQVSVIQTEPAGKDVCFYGPVQKRITAEQLLDAVWGLAGTGPQKIDAEIDDYGDTPARVRAALVVSDLIMRDLGRPNREQVVTTRDEQLSSLQALTLSNGQPFFDAVNASASRLLETCPQPPALIEQVVRSTLCRPPNDAERAILLEIAGSAPDPASVEDLLWSVFMLPEFIHVQ